MKFIFLAVLSTFAPSTEPQILEKIHHLYKEPSKDEGFIVADFLTSLGKGSKSEGVKCRNSSPIVRQIEKRFSQFCRGYKLHLTTAHPSIPKKLHFIWLGSPLNERRYMVLDSWKKFHPEWEQWIWTERELENFPWPDKRLAQLFDEAQTYAEKADIWRVAILALYGGVYSDFDMICLKKFDDFIDAGVTFFVGIETSAEKGYPFSVNNALIGAIKDHKIIQEFIRVIIANGDMDKQLGPHIRTGPFALTQAICNYYIEDPALQKVLILPCTYFYPSWFSMNNMRSGRLKLSRLIKKETMVFHLYEGSWKNGYSI
ncbi:MAG: glycosyltransferase family 32 protein [Chlamydiia bacterium]